MPPMIALVVYPPAVLATIGLIGLGLGTLVWILGSGPGEERRRIRANLGRAGQAPATASPAANAPASSTGPSRIVELGTKAMPAGYLRWLETMRARAGYPTEWPMDKVVTIKVAGALFGFVLFVFFSRMLANPAMGYGVGIATWLLLIFTPDLLLYSKSTERSAAIQLELPDTLDQMSIAVEAGLGFDAAMTRVVRNSNSVLGREFSRTLQGIQVGQSRRDAYEELNDRTRVDDLKRFTRSIVAAETYGLAMSDVLKTQADEMRVKRKQNAEEKAMQIPVKVTIPLMLFILPTLFIVIMGPTVLKMVAMFG